MGTRELHALHACSSSSCDTVLSHEGLKDDVLYVRKLHCICRHCSHAKQGMKLLESFSHRQDKLCFDKVPHVMAQVLDSLITSLAKHTQLLNPAQPQASVAFGADELSCMATETMFELGNRHGLDPSCILPTSMHAEFLQRGIRTDVNPDPVTDGTRLMLQIYLMQSYLSDQHESGCCLSRADKAHVQFADMGTGSVPVGRPSWMW